MVRRVCKTLAKAIRSKGYQLGLWVNKVHLLRTLLLRAKPSKATKTLTRLRSVFLRLYTIQDALCLSLIVDACVVAPPIRCKNQSSNEIQLTIAGSTFSIVRAVNFATPCKITLTITALMLHILPGPTPQTIENILLAKLNGNHHTVRHTLRTGIIVFDVRNITHRIAHFEIDLVRATKHIIEHFFQLGINPSWLVAHFDEYVTIICGFCRGLHATDDQYQYEYIALYSSH